MESEKALVLARLIALHKGKIKDYEAFLNEQSKVLKMIIQRGNQQWVFSPSVEETEAEFRKRLAWHSEQLARRRAELQKLLE